MQSMVDEILDHGSDRHAIQWHDEAYYATPNDNKHKDDVPLRDGNSAYCGKMDLHKVFIGFCLKFDKILI